MLGHNVIFCIFST